MVGGWWVVYGRGSERARRRRSRVNQAGEEGEMGEVSCDGPNLGPAMQLVLEGGGVSRVVAGLLTLCQLQQRASSTPAGGLIGLETCSSAAAGGMDGVRFGCSAAAPGLRPAWGSGRERRPGRGRATRPPQLHVSNLPFLSSIPLCSSLPENTAPIVATAQTVADGRGRARDRQLTARDSGRERGWLSGKQPVGRCWYEA